MSLVLVSPLTVLLLGTAVVAVEGQEHNWKVARLMNDTNFASHNIVGGGCGRNPTKSKYATAVECQAACDQAALCDMWTFVVQPKSGATGPLCCLKSCTVAGKRECEQPNKEVGCVSGVKNVTAYLAEPPPAPPPPCSGTGCFEFAVDWSSASAATSMPTLGRFGVRKVEAFVYPQDGKTYAYADIVNYTCPTWSAKNLTSCPPGEFYYPDSYSTEVGVFSSADGKTVRTRTSVSHSFRIELIVYQDRLRTSI